MQPRERPQHIQVICGGTDEHGTQYDGTRLAGVPLVPKSQIDYLLAASTEGGLMEDLSQSVAQVHVELLSGDFNDFRRDISDHH